MAAGLLLAGAGVAQHEPVRELRGPFPIDEVIDGDTVRILSELGRRTVRLIGIDTPELAHPERGREPFGPEAAAFLRALLPPGKPVWVELDAEREDAYGRLLAYLYLPDPDGAWGEDGRRYRQVNLEVARAGFARPLSIAPNVQYADLFAAAVAEARDEERGMWRPLPAEEAGSGRERSRAPATEVAGGVVIACALYDPEGDDIGSEWVSVEVRTATDTRGMYLFDEGSGSRFPLPPGVQEPGELRIGNPGRGVWNNGGDVIYLMRGDSVVDSFDYSGFRARQGEVVCRP